MHKKIENELADAKCIWMNGRLMLFYTGKNYRISKMLLNKSEKIQEKWIDNFLDGTGF